MTGSPGGGGAAARRARCRSGRAAAARSSGWGRPTEAADCDTRRLDRILEHNVGDFTAVLEAGVPFAEAQAAVRRSTGQRLALDPPRPGRRGDDRRDRRHRRLRPAAPPLRRRARPRRRHHRRAVRRHGRQVRRQGDQERRRLRPGEAVRGLVRHARADRRGRGAAAPAPARDRDRRSLARDDPDALRARGLGRSPRAARGRLLRRRLGRTAPAALLLRFGGASAASRPSAAREHVRLDAEIEPRTTRAWARSARASAATARA